MSPDDPTTFTWTCSSTHATIFGSILFALKGIVTVWGIVLAYRTRQVSENYNESTIVKQAADVWSDMRCADDTFCRTFQPFEILRCCFFRSIHWVGDLQLRSDVHHHHSGTISEFSFHYHPSN
jgi:hypothetical protein